MRIIPMFDLDASLTVVPAVKEALESVLPDSDGNVLVAPAAADVEPLIDRRAPLRVLTRERPPGSALVRLQSLSISGYRDRESGERLLEAVLGRLLRARLSVDALHVHLLDVSTGEAEPEPNSVSGGRSGFDAVGHAADTYHLIRPSIELRHLILPDETRRRLERNLLVIRHFATLMDDWGVREIPGFASRVGVTLNFIGPPGTGKSLAARAIAHELGRPLLEVDYSGLESKYLGETSKNIRAVFEAAREHDAVMLFDEADSFLGRRVEDVRQSYDTAVNNARSVMLMELDAFQGVALFATNLVSNYDFAFRRRILDHIEFPLPDQACRTALLELHVPRRLPGASSLELGPIAEAAEGLSGADLANAVYKACIRTLERLGDDGTAVTAADLLTAIQEIRRSRELIPDASTHRTVNLREVPRSELAAAEGVG